MGGVGGGWKFKILAWQETNRRWDGPIANSFRVENSSLPLHSSDPLNCSPSLPAASPSSSSSSSSFHFCSFSSRFSSRSLGLLDLLSPAATTPRPHVPPRRSHPRWSCRVSIQRPHNRLLAHSVFRFLVVCPLVAAAAAAASPPFSIFFLSNLASSLGPLPAWLLARSSDSSVSYRQRYAALPPFPREEKRDQGGTEV